MIYRIYGQKDTTIYELTTRKAQNTGLDEILEVSKVYEEGILMGNTRILSKFDLTEISKSIVANEIPSTATYQLNLTSVKEDEVLSQYELEIYPISQSWSEGIGQYNDSPNDFNGSSWERREGNLLWNVDETQIFNGKAVQQAPKSGVVLYEGFTEGSGSAKLIDKINDFNGNEPFTLIENEKLIISASNYAGATLVFPAYLQNGINYGVQFQIDPSSFDDVTFRIKDPNGVLKTEGDYSGMVGAITASSTQSFDLLSTDDGVHELQFTFFDGSGDGTTTTGSFDEVYVYQKEGDLLVWDTFTQNEGNFKLRNRVNHTVDSKVRLFASESKLNLYASEGGADAQYSVELEKGVNYQISSSLTPGDFNQIDFTIYDTDGLHMRAGVTGLVPTFTNPTTQSISFTPKKDGNYIFAYTYFNPSNSPMTGSMDDFKITYSGSISTAAISEAGWHRNSGGSTWYTSSIDNTKYSQTFSKYNTNLNTDITKYVTDILSGYRPNDGFLIKRESSKESDTLRYGSSKFFSNNTHTIYVPTLEVKWDDSSFDTGTLKPLLADDITLYMKNLKTEYKELSTSKLRVVGRETYPKRSFTNTAPYNQIKYLPSTTYYQVRDVETNLVLIPFDTTYTKVSCDSTGNFFDFRFNTLQPERFYQFEFRVDRSGNKQYFDGFIFKVVR
tara:strand:+ start:2540 stop:4555 length:2016 start_codon:yes stop_codon:yes gene_type:complete